MFRLAGKIVRVELSVDKEGKSRGFGVVEFSHPVESVQAISMFHNQELFDRQITVRMDRFNESMKLPEGLKSVGPGLGDGGAPLRDVAFNLPNQGSSTPAASSAPGILGAVPNLPLALSNLNSGIGGLNANAVLQAANLAGVGGLQSNLLSNNVGTGDMGLASLVSNQGLLNNNMNGNSFNRTDNFNTGTSGRNFATGYDQKPTSNFGNSSFGTENFSGTNSLLRSSNVGNASSTGGDRKFNCKILIQNVSYNTPFYCSIFAD